MLHPFIKVEDGLVITLCGGVYKQVPLYRRKDHLFAKHGSGFVRLYKQGGTGLPRASWKEIDPGELELDESGYALSWKHPNNPKPREILAAE